MGINERTLIILERYRRRPVIRVLLFSCFVADFIRLNLVALLGGCSPAFFIPPGSLSAARAAAFCCLK